MKKMFRAAGIFVLAAVILVSCAADAFEKHFELASKYLYDHDYSRAINEFEKLIELDPDIPDLYLAKANAEILDGRKDDAEESIFEAIKLLYDGDYNEYPDSDAMDEIFENEDFMTREETLAYWYDRYVNDEDYKEYIEWLEEYLEEYFEEYGDPFIMTIREGYERIEEGDLDGALGKFAEAEKMDVTRPESHIGKAVAYAEMSEPDMMDNIKHSLEHGYGFGNNHESYVQAFIDISVMLQEDGEYEKSLELLDFGYNLTGDERLLVNKGTVIDAEASSILEDLYYMFENGLEEDIRAEIQSEKYIGFMNSVESDDYKHMYFPDNNESHTGTGVALYAVDSYDYGNIFVYYGDFENGERSGTGIWYGAKDNRFYRFEGVWSDDAPNGYGEVQEWNEELHNGMLMRNLKGKLADGCWNGNMNWNFVYSDETDEYVLYFEKGHAEPAEINDESNKMYKINSAVDSEGLWFDYDPKVYTYGIQGFDDSTKMP